MNRTHERSVVSEHVVADRPYWLAVLYEFVASFGHELPDVECIVRDPKEADAHIARALTLLRLLNSGALAELYRSQVQYDHTRYEVGSYPDRTIIELLRRLMKFGSIWISEEDVVESV